MFTLTPRKRVALVAMACCFLVGLVLWRIRIAWVGRDVAFVASASSLPLPVEPWDAASHDDGQFSVLVSIDLRDGERDAVLRTGKFHRADHGTTKVPPQRPSDFRAINTLPASRRVVEGAGDLYHGGGCTKRHAWTALLDKSSGRIWIEVLYPDWGGDGPGCSFPNLERGNALLDGIEPP